MGAKVKLKKETSGGKKSEKLQGENIDWKSPTYPLEFTIFRIWEQLIKEICVVLRSNMSVTFYFS